MTIKWEGVELVHEGRTAGRFVADVLIIAFGEPMNERCEDEVWGWRGKHEKLVSHKNYIIATVRNPLKTHLSRYFNRNTPEASMTFPIYLDFALRHSSMVEGYRKKLRGDLSEVNAWIRHEHMEEDIMRAIDYAPIPKTENWRANVKAFLEANRKKETKGDQVKNFYSPTLASKVLVIDKRIFEKFYPEWLEINCEEYFSDKVREADGKYYARTGRKPP